MYLLLLAVLLVSHSHPFDCVEVHFEAADSGFFLKHSKQAPIAPEINVPMRAQQSPKPREGYDSLLSVDRFTVVETTHPVSIRASYGPFSTKQTVPARYIVPDALETQGDFLNNTTAALIELQQSNIHLDISAHLVRSTVSQDTPVLRALFHAGTDPGGHLQRQKICVLLHVSMGTLNPLKGRCMPDSDDGVCVAEVVIPSSWWPTFQPPKTNSSTAKVPQRFVQVSYSVFEPSVRNSVQCEPKVQIQPLTTFAQVPLIQTILSYKEIRADEYVTIMVPKNPLYPLSKIHIPVFIQESRIQQITAFTMKARVKPGIKLLGATSSSDMWNVSMEKENVKHTTARVMAFKNEDNSEAKKKTETSAVHGDSMVEVFSWTFEISNDSTDIVDGTKIVWSFSYIFENGNAKTTSGEAIGTDETRKKLIVKLETNKDDIQAVLPMAKNWELINTAVLTGRQIAQAMKVFIVSQAGKVADVTLQSSCHAEDESVIKVSSSCSSVYVDGSEIRGSSNASIIVKYGTYVGLAKFIVWMPEFPLEVYIPDFRLSQIKGWKTIDDNHHITTKHTGRRKKRSYVWGQMASYYNNVSGDKVVCKARYQQSPVEVYARFVAFDQNSGRISYFISRRTGLRITDLVQSLLRVADPKIAGLKGRILQGKSIGRTDVQVLSPITGRVIGAKEIRVGSDKVSISKLIVRVVSGLQLTILPDSTIESNGYVAETSVTHKLTAQYQEGLLDIDLEFSDGSRTPLRDVSVEDYFLLVESLDTEVVAFAPMLASHHPRVIAVGEGNGNLLRVTLLLSDDCRIRRNGLLVKQTKPNVTPLATALAFVDVDFNNVESTVSKHESVQNDGIDGRDRKSFHSNGDLADIIGIPIKDEGMHREPTIQARQNHGNGIYALKNGHQYSKKSVFGNVTSMELGMYVLLTAFCFAIIVFVISCIVYASKYRPMIIESGIDGLDSSEGNLKPFVSLQGLRLPKETTTNAHDWVWLGRSATDRIAVTNNAAMNSNTDPRIRITSNPINTFSNTGNNRQQTNGTTFNGAEDKPRVLYAQNYNKNPDYCGDEAFEFRPPVPPHRNIGISTQNNEQISSELVKAKASKFSRINNSEAQRGQLLSMTEHTSASINAITPEHLPAAMRLDAVENNEHCVEKHNVEKLIEENKYHAKNVFKFDTLTLKKKDDDFDEKTGEDRPQAKSNSTTELVVNKQIPHPRRPHVKRATVVGNPMFTPTAEVDDDETVPSETLGLDDLEMNYDQIMHYFDNLKESNA